MTTRVSRLAAAFVLCVMAAALAAQGDSFKVKVHNGAGLDIYMGMDRTKPPIATTGSDGSASLKLDFLNNAALKPRMSMLKMDCEYGD